MSGPGDGGYGDFLCSGVKENLRGGGESGPGSEDVIKKQDIAIHYLMALPRGDAESPSEISLTGHGIQSGLMAGGPQPFQRFEAGDVENPGQMPGDELSLVEAPAEFSQPVEWNGDNAIRLEEGLFLPPCLCDGLGEERCVGGGAIVLELADELSGKSVVGESGDTAEPRPGGGGALVTDFERGVEKSAAESASLSGGEGDQPGLALRAEAGGSVRIRGKRLPIG